MKLIYAQGACSLSVHILLHELGMEFDSVKVSLKDKKVLESYNPRSYVPAIILDDGTLMTEAISILQYLAIKKDSSLFPSGPYQRARCTEWLTFVSSEIHKGLGAYFHPEGMKDEYLKQMTNRLDTRLKILEDHLSEHTYLMGEQYSIADMYALAILRIAEDVKVNFAPFSAVSKYKIMLEGKSLIQKVLNEEQLAPLATVLHEDSMKYKGPGLSSHQEGHRQTT